MPPPESVRPTPSYPTRQSTNYRKGKRSKGPLKRRHWYYVVIMVCGWIVPPLAVAIRFGIGLDFFINVILTCLGWIPGHFHNFWIQNIRNNHNKRHSPAWAVRAGLVKDYRKSQAKKRTWAGKYDDDGVVGGDSHTGRTRWEQQEVIMDPVTGETSHDPAAPAPKPAWQDRDPGQPNTREWDSDLSPQSENSSGASATGAGVHEKRPSGPVRRDSVTGAIIPDGDDLSPTGSNPSSHGSGALVNEKPRATRTRSAKKKGRRPLQEQYAQRYGLPTSPVSPRDPRGADAGDDLDRELQGLPPASVSNPSLQSNNPYANIQSNNAYATHPGTSYGSQSNNPYACGSNNPYAKMSPSDGLDHQF